MDALLLSRIQFGFVISFHILFPSFTIGLASWLAFLEWRWLRTKDGMWLELYKFWLKIFAVSFGMGVVSGIVMSFQFGTNWSILSERAGNILGPLLSYEVLTAFFLEATFLGVMLFGLKRVKPQLHFLATCLVALGTLFSTFWIIAANSWMQTPQGHVVDAQGVFQPVDWWAIIFNPSFPYRLSHMVLAAFITTCFVIGGVSAWYLRRGAHVEEAKRMLRLSVLFAAIAVPAQVFVGDQHGLNMGEHQPAKLAAVEGHWREEPGGVPLVIFGVPNSAEQHNDYEIAVPKLGSVVLTHSLDGQIKPLVAFRPEDRPPVAPVFFAFRVMVGIGTLMLLLTLVSLFALRRGWLFESKWLLRGWNWMLPAGFIAMLSGWWVAEIGRQPWVVYGALRTAHALTPTLAPATVLTSLITFAVVYAIVFGAGIWYLTRLVIKGPAPFEPAPDTEAGDKTPARPLSVGNKEAV